MSAGRLAGRVAVVTGAAQGMGAAHSRRLAAEGAGVAVNDRVDSAELRALAAEIGGIEAVGDVCDDAQVETMLARVRDRLGPIDCLVANHAFMTMDALESADLNAWWKVVETNLSATFRLIQAVVPDMRERGSGRIVVISSEWGVTGWPEASAYAASKAGLIALVKTLGRELAPDGIIVNAVAPGITDTPQLQVDADNLGVSLADVQERYAAAIPLSRIGRPEEIAATVALLCDFSMSAVVGQTVQVNGGTTRGRV